MGTRSRTNAVFLAGLIAFGLPLLAGEPAWHDSTRDVYVNGHLDRRAQVLSGDAGKKLAVLLPDAKKALVLDREGGTFATVPKKAFLFSTDQTAAGLAKDASPGAPPEHPGRCERGPELARGSYSYRDRAGA